MNLEYKRYSRKIWWLGTKLKQTKDKDTRKELIDAIKQHQKTGCTYPLSMKWTRDIDGLSM